MSKSGGQCCSTSQTEQKSELLPMSPGTASASCNPASTQPGDREPELSQYSAYFSATSGQTPQEIIREELMEILVRFGYLDESRCEIHENRLVAAGNALPSPAD